MQDDDNLERLTQWLDTQGIDSLNQWLDEHHITPDRAQQIISDPDALRRLEELLCSGSDIDDLTTAFQRIFLSR